MFSKDKEYKYNESFFAVNSSTTPCTWKLLEPFPDYQVLLSNMAFMAFRRYHINHLLPVLLQYLNVMLRPNEEWGTFFCERSYRIDESD